MNIKTLEVAGFDSAFKGMRNPMDSWDKSDSKKCKDFSKCSLCSMYPTDSMYKNNSREEIYFLECKNEPFNFVIGEKDLELAQRLIKGGTEHSKFMRMIQVWADFNMPRYWFQEWDTYKIGTVANSCSTMHTLSKRDYDINDFELGKNPSITVKKSILNTCNDLNEIRKKYLKTNDYSYVIEMKRLLPESFLQLRTINTNYAQLRNIFFQRRNHRLKEEWIETFCGWLETLPYAKELIMFE